MANSPKNLRKPRLAIAGDRSTLRRTGLGWFAMSLILLVFPTSSRAGLALTLEFNMSSYSVHVGDTVNVGITLHQVSPPDTTIGEPDLSSGGLFGVGIQMLITSQVQISQISPPTGLDPSDPIFADTPSGRLNYSYFLDLVLPIPDSQGNIFLGTYQLTGLSVGMGTLSIAVDPNLAGNAFVDGNVNDSPLDPFITGKSVAINVTDSSAPPGSVVPEPSTLVSATTGGLVVLGYLWRRRRGTCS